MTIVTFFRALVVALLVSAAPVRGEQTPLGPKGAESEPDYSQLFSTGAQLPGGQYAPQKWTRESWTGLTTFARAPPLRCWGAEKDVPFDVAVIGAPFDTATSYRPGWVDLFVNLC
jgi:agmatinase